MIVTTSYQPTRAVKGGICILNKYLQNKPFLMFSHEITYWLKVPVVIYRNLLLLFRGSVVVV